MAQAAVNVDVVQAFRQWLEDEVRATAALGPHSGGATTRLDREDHSTLATRWTLADDSWAEVAVRPYIPQVRVGLCTDNRWRNEELEEKIEETGDTMSEYLEAAFSEADLDWVEPPVEHYREQQKFFYFATPLELGTVEDLGTPAVRQKVLQMLRGYWAGFGKAYTPKK